MSQGFTKSPDIKKEDDAAASGDFGSVGLVVRQDTPATTTSTDGDYTTLKSDAEGRLHVNSKRETASTSTVTSVNDSATSVQLLAANADRKQALFWNNSDASLYLKLGTTASLTDFTAILVANSYYELPLPVYVGRIDGIWASDTAGAVLISELT